MLDEGTLQLLEETNVENVDNYKDKVIEYRQELEAGKNPKTPVMIAAVGAVTFIKSPHLQIPHVMPPSSSVATNQIDCLPAGDIIQDKTGLKIFSGNYNLGNIVRDMFKNIFASSELPIKVTAYEEVTEAKILEQCMKNYDMAGEDAKLPDRSNLAVLVSLPRGAQIGK